MKLNYLELLANAVLASIGGIVKRLSELERKPAKNIVLSSYVIDSFVSMFVGIVVYFMCKNFGASPLLTAGLTALSGYIGVPVLDLLSNIIKKIIDKRIK